MWPVTCAMLPTDQPRPSGSPDWGTPVRGARCSPYAELWSLRVTNAPDATAAAGLLTTITQPQRMRTSGSAPRLRRGWRERIEPGVYRLHRIACPATRDRRPGRRCGCAYQVLVPGAHPGLTRAVTVRGSVTAARAERRRLQAAGRPVVSPPEPDPPACPTLGALAKQWQRTRTGVLAPNTLAEVEVDVRLRIAPVLGHLPIDQISRQQVDELVADLLRTGASVRMVRGVVSTLRRLLQAAVEWELIADNPARRVRLPAPETHTRQAHERVLSMDDLAVLVRACQGSLRTETMIRAMAELGLRRGEVIGLRWDDVDLDDLRLHVRRSVSDVHGVRQERTTKGKRSRRVAISQGFAARLAAWKAARRGGGARGYVWPGRDAAPMNAHSPNQSLARALRRAGLVDTEGVPLVTPHGLRHTSASLMLAAGVPLIVVSRQLGHANPNITAQVYAHLLADSQLDEAAAAFSGLGFRAGDAADHVDHDVVGELLRVVAPRLPISARHPARPHG
jgi:integrase